MVNVKLEDGIMKFSEVFRIKDGKPQHKFGQKFLQWCSQQPDGEYENSCQPLEMSKTRDQLAYIHVLIKIFAEETGVTPFQSKLACKEVSGYYKITKNPIRGGNATVYKSFADASIKELSRIIDEWYSYLIYDVGLNVPTAEEYKNMNAEERSKYR